MLINPSRCRMPTPARELSGTDSTVAARPCKGLGDRLVVLCSILASSSIGAPSSRIKQDAASLLSLPLTGTANVDGELPVTTFERHPRRLASPATACQPCGVKATAFAVLSRRLLPWLWAYALGPRCSDVGKKVRGRKTILAQAFWLKWILAAAG